MVLVNTGGSLRKVLEKTNILDKVAGIQIMKDILHSIGKTDLLTKLDKHLSVGKCFMSI